MDTQKRVSASHSVHDAEAPEYLLNALQHTYAAALGERIRHLRGKTSRAELANELGIHENTLGKFERGNSQPDAWTLMRLCQIKKGSVEWLVTGEDRFGAAPEKSLTAVEHGSFLYVPLFDIQAAAGHGTFVDIERVIAMRPFDLDYIRTELRISHDEIALVGVSGPSAEPELRSGSTVMVDRRDRDVRIEGLHLLRMDDVLLVKMLQRLPGRVLRVSSTNEAFPPFEIHMEEAGQRSIDVIGRVRWGGVTFH